ncbi:MAG: YbgC/FadM family acyl-CoA thioesterase [Candidatus Magnetobacterium sp. LHC-1]|nr:YbgC/FadM family acyl-CoA thioesterase [Nitrospirota bacterium]
MPDTLDIKVYYEDTDCGGVVYYGKYLGYLERARTEFLQQRGIALTTLMQEGLQFVVVHVDIRYHSPARYADIISIHSEIHEVSFASIIFKHRIVKKDTEALIAVSKVKLACVGKGLKPERMSNELIACLSAS